MRPRLALVTLVGLLCAACASTPTRQVEDDDRTGHIYFNNTLGFRLTIPRHWTLVTRRQSFTVPLQLRFDQEQVLEAHNPDAELGLVIVIQHGPVAAIQALVQSMQSVSVNRLGEPFIGPSTTDVRQLSVRPIVVNGLKAAKWIYTAKDTTGGVPIDTTVSFFILIVKEHYVYLTFATPTARYVTAKPTIEAILRTFTPPPKA